MFLKCFKYCIPFIIILLLFQGCSTSNKYKIKSFFFDGVTNPEEIEAIKAILRDGILQDSLNLTIDTTLVANTAANGPTLIHPPYKERACEKCHDRDAMGKPKLGLPELCNTCHTNMEDTFEVLHGPVSSGGCNQCHSPHIAKLDKLLLREGQELCLNCHNEKEVKENKIHDAIEKENCINCHNPHGGENKMILQKGACFNCHENFTEKNEFVHGPADAGKCAVCHEQHSSKAKKLLIKPGNELCLDCHNARDVFNEAYHQKETKNTCISCHNPHASNVKHLLNKATY